MNPTVHAPQAGSATVPTRAGIGLRAPHYESLLELRPDIGWVEVHSENYFGGGPPLVYLERAREHYPLSLHGIGLSLGSVDALNTEHLRQLKGLVDRFEPGFVSDHLCWCSHGGVYLHDLLPLPYTEEALRHVGERVARVQDYLGRPIWVENVSSYLRYAHSTIAEWEFLAQLAARSGCGILLDVNNVYVSACNHGFRAEEYVNAVPVSCVKEIHLAGFAVNQYPEGEVLIDHHGARVAEPVWDLYAQAIARFGPTPTVIEWDTDLPPLAVLLEEARKADRVMEETSARAA